MKITVTQKELLDTLKKVTLANKGRCPMPILSHVLFKDNTVTATDLDVTIQGCYGLQKS